MKRITVQVYLDNRYGGPMARSKNELIQNAVESAIDHGEEVVAVVAKTSSNVKNVRQA